jgi:hypothetical protein
MKKEFIAIIAFLLLFATVNAVNINNCQNLSSSNTYYLVMNNIVAIPGTTCLNINATNVTLDCNGYAITGGVSTGIASNESNTTVKNCTMRNFAIGLDLNNTANGTFQNNQFENNTIDINLVNVNSTNNFVANNFSGTFVGFTSEGANLMLLQTALTPPTTMGNASNYISILSTDPTEWINLNISYDSTNISESTLLLWNYDGATWTAMGATQYAVGDNFILNTSSFGTDVILGCPIPRPYYWGGACYAYISLTVSEEPPNYVIGDVVTLFASLADPTVNVTALVLYYLDANGTAYLNQSLLYSPAMSEWFGVYKLRQSSEFLQVVAFDNTTGNNTVMGYGSFTLNEKPAYSWSDWLLIFGIAIGGVILLLFIIKWIWEGV